MVEWINQAICGMHGHDQLLQLETDRVFLKCISCGLESPGWELSKTQPVVTVAGDRRRHILQQHAPLVVARRAA